MGITAWVKQVDERQRERAPHRTVVGIAGPPGAGKSTLAARLAEEIGAVIAPMDGFHRTNAELERLGRRDRKGAPDTFDADAFVEHLEAVTRGTADVSWPGFDRDIDEPVSGAITIRATAPLVVVEGNYLLLDNAPWNRVPELLDEVAWIDVDDDVRVERLIARHIEFGRSPAEADRFAYGSDAANAALIARSRHRATVVVSADQERN